MKLVIAREILREAMKMGIAPTIEALSDFLVAVDQFRDQVNDYDEWDAMHYSGAEEPQPGFTVDKLNEMMGEIK